MPIIVKDFKWRQTESMVVVVVPLRGVHNSKVDLFTSETYIKASFGQYFFEAYLLHAVHATGGKCTFTITEVIFELTKLKERLWETLELDISRKDKIEIKKRIIEEEHQRLQKISQEKQDKKYELKRIAVRQQIELDSKQKERIENIKDKERNSALGDLNLLQNDRDEPRYAALDQRERDGTKEKANKPIYIESVKLGCDNKRSSQIKLSRKQNKHMVDTDIPVPLPRKNATVEVLFTPREFPTPSRESQREEEEEWLRNQALARRSAGFVSEDLRPEEKNPQYLKEKGDEFLRAKNYLGAISAYSFGIKLSNKFADLYISRSEAHLGLGNMHKVIEDCSRALELISPAVLANLNERAACIARRGIALNEIGMIKQGIDELRAALELQPHNENFKEELKKAIIKAENAT